MRGFIILLAFFASGTLLNKWLHIPLPGNLLGMLILTVCLVTGWIKMELVEQASSFLLRHMLLFFVPILVGVAQYFDLITKSLWPVLLSLFIGPPLVMLASGRIVQNDVNRRNRKLLAEQSEEKRGQLHA